MFPTSTPSPEPAEPTSAGAAEAWASEVELTLRRPTVTPPVIGDADDGVIRLAAAHASATPKLRDGGDRLPDHAALWAQMPLPFTPAEAWHLLSPATQAEIGAAVIGMVLAQYVAGDSFDEGDQFRDEALRDAANDTQHDLLNRIDERLWVLFPDLYGPDGDHPAWALDSGMAPRLPIGGLRADKDHEGGDA